jgi:hypothetical protein
MEQELLVENRFEDAEKLLSQLVRSGFDVTVAFWVLTSDENSWVLYIASNAVDPGKVGLAYGALYAAMSQIPHLSVSLSEVQLVQPSEPIARDAIALRDRNQARLPVRYRGKRLGNLAIEEAYIYPKTGPMTREEVRQTVMALLSRSGPAQPSKFTLTDGTTKEAIPIGLQLQMQGPGRSLQIKLLDPTTNQSELVLANDVVNIQ